MEKFNCCLYCDNDIEYSIYPQGTGHANDCIIRDNWFDDDLAFWSDLHIDENGNMASHCKVCGIATEQGCKCHLTAEARQVTFDKIKKNSEEDLWEGSTCATCGKAEVKNGKIAAHAEDCIYK